MVINIHWDPALTDRTLFKEHWILLFKLASVFLTVDERLLLLNKLWYYLVVWRSAPHMYWGRRDSSPEYVSDMEILGAEARPRNMWSQTDLWLHMRQKQMYPGAPMIQLNHAPYFIKWSYYFLCISLKACASFVEVFIPFDGCCWCIQFGDIMSLPASLHPKRLVRSN